MIKFILALLGLWVYSIVLASVIGGWQNLFLKTIETNQIKYLSGLIFLSIILIYLVIYGIWGLMLIFAF